jgi:2-amino-4-hydroxy-6-hydroxymethyldihydropteridine diphosphokinase
MTTGFPAHNGLRRLRILQTFRAEGAFLSSQVRAYIGLGANVGHPQSSLTAAVSSLAALPSTRLAGVSSLYRTRPVGLNGQPYFLNAVVALDVPTGPDSETGALALLGALKQLEQALGRLPRERWGPRELDLDLLLFGGYEVRAERPDGRRLQVPHPQMRERLFVLAPLAELAGELRPPGWSETVAEAAARRRDVEGERAVRRLAAWTDGQGWS